MEGTVPASRVFVSSLDCLLSTGKIHVCFKSNVQQEHRREYSLESTQWQVMANSGQSPMP